MDGTNKKSLIVKGVCVLLSFILWLYVSNVENPIRTSEVKGIAVELENRDILSSSNLYIKEAQSPTVDLKLEGAAKEIYSVSKNDFVLKADLSSYALKKGENNIPVEVVNSPEGVSIKNKAVLTVKVDLEEGKEKTVKVYSKVKTTFKDGVSERKVSVSPSTVKVTGPETLVDQVSSVMLKGELSNISKDITQNFELVPIDVDGNEISGVELSEEKGKLTVSVGTEKNVKVNAIYKGSLPDNMTLKGLTLSEDTVRIVGESSKLKSISKIDTEPIDLSEITESKSISIKLAVPDGISLTSGNDKITGTIEVAQKENTENNEVVTKKIDGVHVTLKGKENSNLTFEVDSITVELSGKNSELKAITAENIIASASVAEITEAGEREVPLEVSITGGGTSVNIKTKPDKIKITAK